MVQLPFGLQSLFVEQILSCAMQVSRCLALYAAGIFLFSGVLASRPEKCAMGNLEVDPNLEAAQQDPQGQQMLEQLKKGKGIPADPMNKYNGFEKGKKVCGPDANNVQKCCFATNAVIHEFNDHYWNAKCTKNNCCCEDGAEPVGMDDVVCEKK